MGAGKAHNMWCRTVNNWLGWLPPACSSTLLISAQRMAAVQVFQRLREEDLDGDRGLAMLQYAQQASDSARLDRAAFKRLCREALDVA